MKQSAVAGASYDAPAEIHNSPSDHQPITPELRESVASEQLQYALEALTASQELLSAAQSRVQQLAEALREQREYIAALIEPLLTARAVQKRKSRSLAVADRRVENKGTAYGRKSDV